MTQDRASGCVCASLSLVGQPDAKDLARGFTADGPHGDELALEIVDIGLGLWERVVGHDTKRYPLRRP